MNVLNKLKYWRQIKVFPYRIFRIEMYLFSYKPKFKCNKIAQKPLEYFKIENSRLEEYSGKFHSI